MQAIEFNYDTTDGMIKIPETYTDWFKKPVKVILLTQELLHSPQFTLGHSLMTQEILLAAVAKWYELGLISQEKGAEITGLSREEFLLALSRFQVSPFQYTAEDLDEELQNAS
ncbi:protein of unknown function UPF0175 [Beggiatoa sp. PS]|nr:protein of unknown function UPF0175 [Beggiatoa sp. PS]